jgi:hypothetical protein
MNFHVTGILGWLLKPLFALCMLGFAAGGTALGGDSGGGLGLDDGGGDEGAGGGEFDGGGDEGDGGGSEEDLGESDEGLEEHGGDNTGQRSQLTPQQKADAAREKALSPEVRKALKTIAETDSKAAAKLRSAVFASQAWAQVMPGGIRQAREMATAFEEVGGVEGIQTLRDETQTLQAELDGVDEKWTAADPQFFATLAENDPDAFVRAAPVVVEQLLKTDPAAYSSLMGRIFHNTMTQKGVVRTLEALLHHANANKATAGMAPVVQQIEALLNWTDSIRDLAQSQPERKPDKGLAKLKEKETAFEAKQATAFKGEVGREIKTHLEGGIMREVGKLLKARNVNLAQLKVKDKERFMAMVAEADRQLAQEFSKDKAFHAQKDRLMQTRDKERVMRLYQQKIDYLLADARGPRIAKKVANIFYRGAAPAPRTGAQGGQDRQQGERQNQGDRGQRRDAGGDRQNTQVQRVGARPDPSTIDYSRTTDDMILDGQAVLKGSGKKVQWR